MTEEFTVWAEAVFGNSLPAFLPKPIDDALVSCTYYIDDQERVHLSDFHFGCLTIDTIPLPYPTGAVPLSVPMGDYRFTQLSPFHVQSQSIYSLIDLFVKRIDGSRANEAKNLLLLRAVREPEGYSFQLWEPKP